MPGAPMISRSGRDPRVRYIVKTVTQTVNNSAALVDDNALTCTLASPAGGGHYYAWQIQLLYNSSAVADIRFNVVAPGSDTTLVYFDMDNNFRTYGTNFFVSGSGAAALYYMMGFTTLVGAGDVLKLQWAQQTAEVSNTTVYEGSWMKVIDLGPRP